MNNLYFIRKTLYKEHNHIDYVQQMYYTRTRIIHICIVPYACIQAFDIIIGSSVFSINTNLTNTYYPYLFYHYLVSATPHPMSEINRILTALEQYRFTHNPHIEMSAICRNIFNDDRIQNLLETPRQDQYQIPDSISHGATTTTETITLAVPLPYTTFPIARTKKLHWFQECEDRLPTPILTARNSSSLVLTVSQQPYHTLWQTLQDLSDKIENDLYGYNSAQFEKLKSQINLLSFLMNDIDKLVHTFLSKHDVRDKVIATSQAIIEYYQIFMDHKDKIIDIRTLRDSYINSQRRQEINNLLYTNVHSTVYTFLLPLQGVFHGVTDTVVDGAQMPIDRTAHVFVYTVHQIFFGLLPSLVGMLVLLLSLRCVLQPCRLFNHTLYKPYNQNDSYKIGLSALKQLSTEKI